MPSECCNANETIIIILYTAEYFIKTKTSSLPFNCLIIKDLIINLCKCIITVKTGQFVSSTTVPCN